MKKENMEYNFKFEEISDEEFQIKIKKLWLN